MSLKWLLRQTLQSQVFIHNFRSVQTKRIFTKCNHLYIRDVQGNENQSQTSHPNIVNFYRQFHLSTVQLKKKSKTGAGKIKQVVSPSDVEDLIDLFEIQKQLEEMVKELQHDMGQNFRVGTDLSGFEQLKIPVGDEIVDLCDIGQIVRVTPKLVTIDLVAFPECIPQVQAVLQESSINCNPTVTGSIIKVAVSQATAEYRRDLVKKVKVRVGLSKSDIHNLVTKETNQIFADKSISIDLKKNIAEQLKLYGQHYATQVDQISKTKESALLEP